MYPHSGRWDACLVVQASLAEEAESPVPGSRAYVVIEPRAIYPGHGSCRFVSRNVLRGHILHLLRNRPYRWSSAVSIVLAGGATPLIAEITESSAQRLARKKDRWCMHLLRQQKRWRIASSPDYSCTVSLIQVHVSGMAACRASATHPDQ